MGLVVIVIAAVVAVVLFLDLGASRTVVPVTVVESRFQPERANDGRTVTTVVTDDGRRHSVSRPGRDTLVAGQVVQAEIVRGKVRRLIRN